MKNIYVIMLTFCLSTVCIGNIFAQLTQPKRFEITLKEGENAYDVIKGEGNHLLLFRKIVNNSPQEGQFWEVMQLDTAFRQVWKQVYAIDRQYLFANHKYYKQKLHLLFTNMAGNKTDLELIAIDTNSGIGRHHHIENLIPFNLIDFEVSTHGVLIGGYYNYRPLVLYYDFELKKAKVLPGFYHEKSELVQLKVNEDETVDVILSGTAFGGRKNRILAIMTFDYRGNLISNTLLDNIEEKSLLYGRSCEWEGETKLIAGTYGRKNSEYSRGLFLANINRYGEHSVNFYNYSELKNFFGYMRTKREKRIQDRIERRKLNQKRIKFNYRLLVHDVFRKEDQYIMLGEAFYPKYIYPTAATASGIFRRAGESGTETVFDGYRYTHAVVLGFDNMGKLLWDNSFEITDVKTFDQEQFVKASIEEDRIVLLYLYDNVIRSKIIKENEVLEGKTFNQLKLKFENDVVSGSLGDKMNGLEQWYGNTYVAYGIQNIKNATNSELRRRVFFLNKIVYQ